MSVCYAFSVRVPSFENMELLDTLASLQPGYSGQHKCLKVKGVQKYIGTKKK